jgi:hypothetical protein
VSYDPNAGPFKDIISASEVEASVEAQLRFWFDTYLRELERQHDYDTDQLPSIRSYTTIENLQHNAEQQTPAIVIVSPGMRGKPVHSGDGWYRGDWVVGIAAFVAARDDKSSDKLAKTYGAAIRAIMLQKRVPLGIDVTWVSETYDDAVVADDGAQLSAALLMFDVTVDGIVKSVGAGPLVPGDAYPDLPVVIDQPGRVIVNAKEE